MSKRILVTGGAGFIGSHLVEGLIEQGFEVEVLDNLATGQLDNLKHLWENKKLHFTFGDIRNREIVKTCLRDVEDVVHLAAVTSVKGSIDEPLATLDINASGTLNLLMASVDARVRRFVLRREQGGGRGVLPSLRQKLRARYYLPATLQRVRSEAGRRRARGRHQQVRREAERKPASCHLRRWRAVQGLHTRPRCGRGFRHGPPGRKVRGGGLQHRQRQGDHSQRTHPTAADAPRGGGYRTRAHTRRLRRDQVESR
ncbi:MAG: NAD-dependent epimerase/dehydratase family protein [Thaumarchaeota archaeon]|nr:MAG: NAD-dependent epimerase/dehydratase family protein [Nitrososphaerota archaeon]